MEKREIWEALCNRHSTAVQKKLDKAKVAVAGLGGLGSNIAVSLARIGVGHLHLLDFDEVDLTNLNRQYYFTRHIGMKKTEALKEILLDINPYLKYQTDCGKVKGEDIPQLFEKDEYICEAFDRAEEKAMLVNGIREYFPDKVLVAGNGMAGYGKSNEIQTRKVGKNFYICGDGTSESVPGRGLMAPRVALCAAHQANLITKLIIESEIYKMETRKDTWKLGNHEFQSRFILGSGKYSLELIQAAVEQAKAEIVTMALRRANEGGLANILDYIPKNVTLLPNTSGARNEKEAVRIARLSREICQSEFVKIEIMRDSKYLLPDNYETAKATEILAKEGFVVMPYMYPDLNAARDMVNAGAACVMPLGAPIGSNKGLCTKEFIQILIDEIELPVIVGMQVLEDHLRRVRQWRWELRLLWQIQLLLLPEIFLLWQRHLKMQWKQDEVRTCQDLAE